MRGTVVTIGELERLTALGQRAVTYVKSCFPGGAEVPFVIAGGYFRDLLLGGPINDIDVFVHPAGAQGGCLLNAEGPYGDILGHVDIIGLYSIGGVGREVQRITLNPARCPALTPEGVCSRIDIGICRIAMDHTGRLYVSPEAMADVSERTLTVYLTNGATSERVKARLQKIKDRYSHLYFETSDPQELLNAS